MKNILRLRFFFFVHCIIYFLKAISSILKIKVISFYFVTVELLFFFFKGCILFQAVILCSLNIEEFILQLFFIPSRSLDKFLFNLNNTYFSFDISI